MRASGGTTGRRPRVRSGTPIASVTSRTADTGGISGGGAGARWAGGDTGPRVSIGGPAGGGTIRPDRGAAGGGAGGAAGAASPVAGAAVGVARGAGAVVGVGNGAGSAAAGGGPGEGGGTGGAGSGEAATGSVSCRPAARR